MLARCFVDAAANAVANGGFFGDFFRNNNRQAIFYSPAVVGVFELKEPRSNTLAFGVHKIEAIMPMKAKKFFEHG